MASFPRTINMTLAQQFSDFRGVTSLNIEKIFFAKFQSERSVTTSLDNNNILLGGDVNLGCCDDVIDQERLLRDPLGLESLNALLPEQIDSNDNHEEENMPFGDCAGNDDHNDALGEDFNVGCFESEMQQQLGSTVQDPSVNVSFLISF